MADKPRWSDLVIKLDDWWDIAIAGVIILGTVGMLLAFFRRGGHVRAGSVTVGGDDTPVPAPVPVVSVSTLPCDSYQHDHMAALDRLSASLDSIAKTMHGINQMQLAETEALDVLLGLAEGDAINGQVKAARRKLTLAEGYKEASDAIGGM